jgi:hypothetical protein
LAGFVGAAGHYVPFHDAEEHMDDGRHDFDFQHGQCQDVIKDIPVVVQFRWTTAPHRWEQAFSFDEGVTWVDNWVMDFTPSR